MTDFFLFSPFPQDLPQVIQNALNALDVQQGDLKTYLETSGFPLGDLDLASDSGRQVALDHILTDLIVKRYI